MELVSNLSDQVQAKVNRFNVMYEIARHDIEKMEVTLALHRSQMAFYEKAMFLLQEVSKRQEGFLRDKFVKVVRYGLGMTFGDDMGFDIISDTKANQRIMYPSILNDAGEPITDILGEDSGGVGACIAFMMNAMMLIWNKTARKIMFLDEKFTQISKEYKDQMLEMVKLISKKFGMQIVIITQDTDVEPIADLKYRFSKRGGQTVMEVA